MKYMMLARVFMLFCNMEVSYLYQRGKWQVQTLSNCSRMQECRSSHMSLFFSAYAAALCAELTDALRCCSCDENRIRTSNGSAMVLCLLACAE